MLPFDLVASRKDLGCSGLDLLSTGLLTMFPSLNMTVIAEINCTCALRKPAIIICKPAIIIYNNLSSQERPEPELVKVASLTLIFLFFRSQSSALERVTSEMP